MQRSILFWRRTDVPGLERLELARTPQGLQAEGVVLTAEDGGLRLEHRWSLDPQWRASRVAVRRWDAQGERQLLLEREGAGWRVDGLVRPDLAGCDEPDLSVTPFCNTLAVRRTPEGPGAAFTLDVAYIDGATLQVQRSRQRYHRQGRGRVRYVDLGVAAGFEADLVVDDQGLVLAYEGLFERVLPAP